MGVKKYNDNVFSEKWKVFLLILFFIFPVVGQSGTVVFDFDPTSVTVVENESVFVFPGPVFSVFFGASSVGKHVSLDKRHEGFRVDEDSVVGLGTQAELTTDVLKRIDYGGAIYYQKGQYFYFGGTDISSEPREVTRLSARDVEFTWIVPRGSDERSPASISKVRKDSDRSFVKFEEGQFKIRGEILESETLGIKAIGIGDKIYFVKGDLETDASEAKGDLAKKEVMVDKNQLLWIADRSY